MRTYQQALRRVPDLWWKICLMSSVTPMNDSCSNCVSRVDLWAHRRDSWLTINIDDHVGDVHSLQVLLVMKSWQEHVIAGKDQQNTYRGCQDTIIWSAYCPLGCTVSDSKHHKERWENSKGKGSSHQNGTSILTGACRRTRCGWHDDGCWVETVWDGEGEKSFRVSDRDW